MKKIGVVTGSFDPVTNGHLGLIDQAMLVVDELHVVVGHNPAKKYLFTSEERVKLMEDTLFDRWGDAYLKRMKVILGERELLVKYAQRVGAKFLVRGIRNGNDYLYEAEMESINKDIERNIETIFFLPPHSLANISSSTVKGLFGFEGSKQTIEKYVPRVVQTALYAKLGVPT